MEQGNRQAVFVTGEPGSGKTRLASVVAQALHEQGCTVLLGTSSQDIGYPYKPFVEALGLLLDSTTPGDLDEIMPDSATELIGIAPGLRRHIPAHTASAGGKSEYRRELFAAFADIIRSLSTVDRPLALFLEDLHWSTAPTIELLSYLVQSTDHENFLIFATLRNNAPDRSEELTFAIADLYRLPGVERIDLSGLSTGEIEKYLAAETAGSREFGKEAAALLKDHTGGNPFFLRELWRDISAEGGFQAFKSGRFAAPVSVRDSLENRFRSFEENELIAIEFAAVMGDTFEPDVLAQASGLDRDSLLIGLDQAIEYGLIRSGPDSGKFSFQHTLIRQAILDRLKPSRSAQIHAAVATTLSQRIERSPILAPHIASLYLGALNLGYESEAVSYLSIAARQAEAGLAHEEAATLWETAADVHQGDRLEGEQMSLSAAQAHVRASNFTAGVRLYAELAHSEKPDVALMAAIGHEDAAWRASQEGATGRDLLLAALDRYIADPNDPLYIRGIAGLGRAHAFAGDLAAAEAIGEEAVEMARQLGDDHTTAYVLHSTLPQGWSPARIDLLSERVAELTELGRRIGYYDCLGTAATWRATIGLMKWDRVEWDAGGVDLRFLVAKTGERFWEWVAGLQEFQRMFIDARFSDASRVLERLHQEVRFLGAVEPSGPYGLNVYMVKRETGELEAVRHLITGDPTKDGTWAPGLLSLYTELGMGDSVRNLLWSMISHDNREQKDTAIWAATLAFLAEAAIFLGDRKAMEMILPDLLDYEDLNLVPGVIAPSLGSSNRYIAEFYDGLGMSELAEEQFLKALTMDIAVGSVVHRAETLARFSNFLSRKGGAGDAKRAAEYRRQAIGLAESRGQQRVLNMLKVSASDLPDGLTPRELDVLHLLAKGASNQEIADQLFISHNTAANHVRSILMKTMLSNRTQAAIYAAEHELL